MASQSLHQTEARQWEFQIEYPLIIDKALWARNAEKQKTVFGGWSHHDWIFSLAIENENINKPCKTQKVWLLLTFLCSD